MVKQGGGTLTLTGASALDWSVQAGALSSAAERFSGNAAISPGATLILDQTVDATYGGALSGGGSLIKRGAGALIQAGNSVAFTGSTVVSAGSLIVGADAARAAAVLGGSVSVQDGARLGGHGTVGSGAGSVVTVEPGGTLAPGNSIGTFTVNGELVVARGPAMRSRSIRRARHRISRASPARPRSTAARWRWSATAAVMRCVRPTRS